MGGHRPPLCYAGTATVEIRRIMWYSRRCIFQNTRKGMGLNLKKLISAGLVIFMLAFLLSALAGAPGTPENPLVTRGYLHGAVRDSLRDGTVGVLEELTDSAIDRLNQIYISHAGFSFAPRFTKIELLQDDKVTLTTGSSFVLLEGSASITVVSGSVISISTGNEVSSGQQLTRFHRYFGAEDAQAVITAHSAVSGHVDGFFIAGDAAVVTPPQTPGSPLPFNDVRTTDWFFGAVSFVFERGFFTGTAADTFSPESPMSRAMFVTVLHRLAGLPQAVGGGFDDVQNVPASSWYYNAVMWANASGIVTGVGAGRFDPHSPVTREQMAAIMYRYAGFMNFDLSSDSALVEGFADIAQVSDFAAEPVRWAVTHSVMQGSGGRLMPLDTATRAQVAQIIYNFHRNVIG